MRQTWLMDLEGRTAGFFSAVATQNVEAVAALCSPDFRLKQNNGPEVDVATSIAGLQGLWGMGIATSYGEVRRAVGDRVVTEQHVVTMTRADGATAACDVCVVVRFGSGGLISRIDEYADSAAFAALFG